MPILRRPRSTRSPRKTHVWRRRRKRARRRRRKRGLRLKARNRATSPRRPPRPRQPKTRGSLPKKQSGSNRRKWTRRNGRARRLNAPPTPRLPSRPWLLRAHGAQFGGERACVDNAPSSAPVVAQTPAQQTASLTPPRGACRETRRFGRRSHQIGADRIAAGRLLRRSADGEWDKASRLSLEKFNRYAGAELTSSSPVSIRSTSSRASRRASAR